MAFIEKSGKNRWRVRYWAHDGTHRSIPGFPTKKAAEAKARDIDTDQHRGTFTDPKSGKVPLREWCATWTEALDVTTNTENQYRSLLRNHIMPRWGNIHLGDIDGIAVQSWLKDLRKQGYAHATIESITKVLSMMLADAAWERRIITNPIRPARRGRKRRTPRTEALWASPHEVLRIALHAAALTGPWAGVLILTAAYTGARWGELAGLQRHNLDLEHGRLTIDPEHGALHEVNGTLTLGPPKTEESARTITLPPFLTNLLRTHLHTHTHPNVFVTNRGELLRRSNFARRAMRPATDGNHNHPDPTPPIDPVRPGLTFHGLRHSHKTWMIADHTPPVAQARRLGHILADKIEHTYSHVADEVDTRLLAALQHRWEHSLTTLQESTTRTGNNPLTLTIANTQPHEPC